MRQCGLAFPERRPFINRSARTFRWLFRKQPFFPSECRDRYMHGERGVDFRHRDSAVAPTLCPGSSLG